MEAIIDIEGQVNDGIDQVFQGRDGRDKHDDSERKIRERANTVEDKEGKTKQHLSMDKGIGEDTTNFDRNSTLENENPESKTIEFEIPKLKTKPRYINSQQFSSQTNRFNPLKGFSAEEGRRTRKAKTISNLRTNIPWNNYSHSPSGCPASMECVLYGKRTFHFNYP